MINAPFVRSPYNYDADLASDDSGLRCLDPSLTQQHFADECDINRLMRKYSRASDIPAGIRLPEYGDFTGIHDYHSAASRLAGALETFDALPAELRARFENDPGRFVDFVIDEKNRDELVSMGLAKAKPVEVPPVAPKDVVAPPTAPIEPKGSA